MSTSQFRIREFQAANDRLAEAKSKVKREQEELEFQKREAKEARSRLEFLEKRLAKQELRVRLDQKKLDKAELNLKEVEDRWQVHDVDDATDVTPSSPTKSPVNADSVEDVIDLSSPNSTTTTSVNHSDDSLNNANEEDKEATLPSLVRTTSNDNNHSGKEKSGRDDDDGINGTPFAPGSFIFNNDDRAIDAAAKKTFLFENIIVEDCGVSCANGQYEPVAEHINGVQVYSKPGHYRGQAAMFRLCHFITQSRWLLIAICGGRATGLYVTVSRDEFKDNVPRRGEWVSITDAALPLPTTTGQKNNSLALSH